MKSCPACAEETFLASQCREILVVSSIKTYTSPVSQLCANHRYKRKHVDVNESTVELRPGVPKRIPSWQPIDVELVKDGFLARVTRQIGRAGRWRWSVTPVEITQRHHSQPVEHAYARGYAKGRERAMKMAEAAIVALKKVR